MIDKEVESSDQHQDEQKHQYEYLSTEGLTIFICLDCAYSFGGDTEAYEGYLEKIPSQFMHFLRCAICNHTIADSF